MCLRLGLGHGQQNCLHGDIMSDIVKVFFFADGYERQDFRFKLSFSYNNRGIKMVPVVPK